MTSEGETQDKLAFGACFLCLEIKEVLSKRIKIKRTIDGRVETI